MKYLIFILIVLSLTSCRTINYTDKAGNSLKINSFCWDTSIGSMTATNGTESISLNNYNSQPDQMALQLADDVIKVTAPLIASTKPSK